MAIVITGKNKFNINADYYTGSLSSLTGEFTGYDLKQCDVSGGIITIESENNYKGYVTEFMLVNEITDYVLSFQADTNNFNVLVVAYNKYQNFVDSIYLRDSDDREIHFRTPEGTKYIRISFEEHLRDRPIRFSEIQLEEGTVKTSWEPYEEQIIESYGYFREDIYNWMKETLSPNLTKGDLDIIVRLMCYIFGDLDGITQNLKKQIDPDEAEEIFLRHLCTVIGYEWNEGLTADQQREAIKMYIDIRRRRGTVWSLENLIRVFGQDATSFYSSSDLRGVKVIEYQPGSEPDANGLYHGDLMIEVPQFSNILRFAVDNIRLIGTRIVFAYMIYVGIFKAITTINAGREVHQFFDPAYWGYDPVIKTWGPNEETTPISDIQEWFITHRVRSAKVNVSFSTYVGYKAPYQRGFIWHEPGDDNYKGFLVDDETFHDEHTMYGNIR